MRTLSKSLLFLLSGMTIMASCSRPVAYFQPTAREQYKTIQSQPAPAVAAVEATKPAEVSTPAAEATAAPAEQVAQAKQAVSQLEAYVRNDNKLASNKKVAKRMARLNEVLATSNAKAAVSTNATSAKKVTLMERLVLKKMDKKIKNHVAPDQAKASSNTRLGLIIGVVGLILILVGSIASSGAVVLLGLIGLIVGLVLLLIGLAGNG